MNDIITLLVTGDYCIRGKTEELVLKQEYDKVFKDIVNYFKDNDLNIVDLESPLTKSTKGMAKTGPVLKSIPESIHLLNYLSVHLVAMSNNHIMDYGINGLNDTILTCKKAEIDIVGVGKNITESRKPFFTKIKQKKIAIINISENEFSSTYGEYPGANPLNIIDNYHDIVKVKNHVDWIFVLYHGGNEFYELPSPRVKKTCRFFVDAGADAVIMHHTHAYSGYEIYDKTPIFYGLGNFNFEWEGRVNNPWNYGYTVRFQLSDNNIDFKLLPHQQSNGNQGTFPLSDTEKTLFFQKIEALNLIIQDDEELEKRFISFCKKNNRLYDMYLQPYSGKIFASLYHKGILPDLLTKRKKRLIKNLIRCESHRDILLYLLDK